MNHCPPWIRIVLVLLALLTMALPQAAAESEAVTRWLDKLEARGKQIQTFEAEIVYETFQPLIGERQTRRGEAYFVAPKTPEADDAPQRARFAVHFKQLIVGADLFEKRLDWVFDGRWLVEKNHENKFFKKRQIVQPGEDFDPLRIDGPMPLPLGQKREEVLRRFDVRLIEDPPQKVRAPLQAKDLLHLELEPKAPAAGGNKAAAQFEQIDLWFDKQTLLPVKVRTKAKNGEQTTVRLRKARVNQLEPKRVQALFDIDTPKGDGWKIDIGAAGR